MKLIASGDSFIWGCELADSPHCGPNGYSLSTYPALLAKEYNLDYECVAVPGSANQAISRATIDACEKLNGESIFVFCSWTFAQRFEFHFNSPANRWIGKWYSVSSWHGSDDWKFVESELDPKVVRNFAKTFFKEVGDNEYYEVYSILREILFLQYYLKSKNIPYLFTCAGNNIFYENECFIRSNDESMRNIWNQIDWSQWYLFPPGQAYPDTTSPRGFYQWAVENKYKQGPDYHPLEDAHKDATILIKEKFNELVTQHNQQNQIGN